MEDWDSGRDIEARDEAEVGDGGMEGAKEVSENAIEEAKVVESNTSGGVVVSAQKTKPSTISVTLGLKAWKNRHYQLLLRAFLRRGVLDNLRFFDNSGLKNEEY